MDSMIFKIVDMKRITLILVAAVLIMSCENPIRMETKVHEDGSLDKTIVLEETDSTHITNNVFGIDSGWMVAVRIDSAKKKNKNHVIEFKKHFASVEDMNRELDQESDTLFRIKSSFDKRFRWFYTYVRYEETFRPIDRFKRIKSSDYFTPEDSLFIARLKGEGTAISKADSSFLENLNDRIFNQYASRGVFEEVMETIRDVMKKNSLEPKWLDSLNKYQDILYQGLKDDLQEGDTFLQAITDSLGIPMPASTAQDFEELSKEFNSRKDFMSYAQDGKYTVVVNMPWTITATNADSISGTKAFWKPLPTKFAINNYTMYTEARKMNVWAVIVSGVVILITIVSFVSRKSRKNSI